MLFNSFKYLLFLPTFFILYWFVFKQMKWQNLLVVIASYFFYGLWDWRFLFLIALTSLCSFITGIYIDRFQQRGKHRHAKYICLSNVVINLAILGVFKYYNFFAENLVQLLSAFGMHVSCPLLSWILPVGISFYTFQALSYSIDIYQQKMRATHDVVAFFAFISFFPQLVAGPIERATNLLPQFQRERCFHYFQATDGLRQILWGLFKKTVIADNCAVYVDQVFNHYDAYSGTALALGAFFFTFQIYGDFSGYSDMAIGTAKLLGISLQDNFKTPYFSRDMAEFWKRWHISLNKWFVDYVYIPLGGSRGTKFQVVRNVFVIFLLSGLWHGANWTYISWGLYHATLFLPLILLNKNKRYSGVVADGKMLPSAKEATAMALTFLLAMIGWILFRSENIHAACHIFAKILTERPDMNLPLEEHSYKALLAIPLCLAFEWANRAHRHGLDIARVRQPWVRFLLYYIILISIVLFSGEAITFIYFQF
ncbi:MAG: MBOAT family O-acyltransferase [Bacteroidaceae bacterium]